MGIFSRCDSNYILLDVVLALFVWLVGSVDLGLFFCWLLIGWIIGWLVVGSLVIGWVVGSSLVVG